MKFYGDEFYMHQKMTEEVEHVLGHLTYSMSHYGNNELVLPGRITDSPNPTLRGTLLCVDEIVVRKLKWIRPAFLVAVKTEE